MSLRRPKPPIKGGSAPEEGEGEEEGGGGEEEEEGEGEGEEEEALKHLNIRF